MQQEWDRFVENEAIPGLGLDEYQLRGRIGYGMRNRITDLANKKETTIDEFIKTAGGVPSSSGMDMLMMNQAASAIGTIVGALFAIIYPVLVLILMNQRAVKEYLAQHGR